MEVSTTWLFLSWPKNIVNWEPGLYSWEGSGDQFGIFLFCLIRIPGRLFSRDPVSLSLSEPIRARAQASANLFAAQAQILSIKI